MKILLKGLFLIYKMFKKLIFLSMCLVATFADTCFTKDQINGSNKLFTYKGKVYDSTGYKHPGGQNDIKKLVGKDLSEFVNSKKESFHLDSSRFYKQLDNMYVGELQNSCPSNSPVTETTSDSPVTETTSDSPVTETTSVSPVTETTTKDIIPIISSSNRITTSVFMLSILLIIKTIYII